MNLRSNLSMKKIVSIIFVLASSVILAQQIVPSVYTNIKFMGKQGFAVNINDEYYFDRNEASFYNLPNLMGNPIGTNEGFDFDFNDKEFSGTMYFGFLNYDDYKYIHPVYFKKPVNIHEGKASINMLRMRGKYDMIDWEKKGRGDLAYRIIDVNGKILYDGKIAFKKSSAFEVLPTIIEGPILSILTDSSVVASYTTNFDVLTSLSYNGKTVKELKPEQKHEINLTGLEDNTEYQYSITCSDNIYKFSFKTAPIRGSRSKFTFAYASDSRSGAGGGERNILGTNAYIVKKSVALASQQNAVFMQFTGDLVNGYSENMQLEELQFANYKAVISPFASYMPMYFGMGNHEVLERYFPVKGEYGVHVDRFPFDTQSMEASFANQFSHPLNGPDSEDGESYDPDPDKQDFPTYKENVYYYTYDNIAVVVLNSEYLYSPSLRDVPETSGGLHGYLMDGQLKWLKKVLNLFEKDLKIDHIFITEHTPPFPNGGHTHDAMWYGGDNKYRTIIAGKPMKRGVIEQRDQYLDLIINKSSKVRAVLTGDEHNYCKTKISDSMNRYPENWTLDKLKLNRSIFQINNGACGAPYYAQEQMPWSDYTSGFSTQNALVLFDIDGDNIHVRVLNPDTLEEIESYDLR